MRNPRGEGDDSSQGLARGWYNVCVAHPVFRRGRAPKEERMEPWQSWLVVIVVLSLAVIVAEAFEKLDAWMDSR